VCAADDVGRGGDRFEAAGVAAGAFDAFAVNRDVAELARKARIAVPEFAVHDERAADACADGDVEHVTAAASRARDVLAVGGGVGVVDERDGEIDGAREFRLQIGAHD
jgi:hypothetical protein